MEGYLYFGLKLTRLEIEDDGDDWTKQSEEIIDVVHGEINNLVLRLIIQGIQIKSLPVDQEGRIDG